METELRPLLPRAMSACAPGCGPSALAALHVNILSATSFCIFEPAGIFIEIDPVIINILIQTLCQARDLKAFKEALDEEDFDCKEKHLVDGVHSTLLQVGWFYLSVFVFESFCIFPTVGRCCCSWKG